jgi:hypothetical protein
LPKAAGGFAPDACFVCCGNVCAPRLYAALLVVFMDLKWFSGGGFVLNFYSCGTALLILNLAPEFG